MYILLSKLINMSIYGGLFILAVLFFRMLLNRAPKKIVIVLWALVAIRLLVPINVGSSLSVFNLFNTFGEKIISEGFVEYSNTPEKPELLISTIQANASGHTPDIYMPPVLQIWIGGMVVFAIYAFYSYIKLKRKVSVSIEEKGLYLCDSITSPFILGLFNPKIYIPSNLNDEIKVMVLSHEKMHIKRMDYIWKPLGFVVLAIHWFNPLVWIGFIVFCRDLELACDEAVISDMEDEEKLRYSEALFACATKGNGISPCPIAFGEIGVKMRIEMTLKYRKPHIAFVTFAVVCVIVCGICFLSGPVSNANIVSVENQDGLAKQDEAGIPYTDFVGDNSTVSAIVSYMTFPEGLIFDHIELDTSEEPYGLTIVLCGSGDKDFDLFSKNADLAFEHIGNLSSVMFINKDTGELISVASKGTYLPNEIIPNPDVQGEGSTDYLPSETIIRHSSDGTDSNDVVDYIYNIDADPNTASEENTTTYIVDENTDIYSSYRLRDMAMGFYKGYINGDLKMVQTSLAKISSMKPTVFEKDPGKVSFLGIVDADKVVSGESNIMYIAFEDKNNDEGTKKFLELHITKEPDGWKVFGYDTIIEN